MEKGIPRPYEMTRSSCNIRLRGLLSRELYEIIRHDRWFRVSDSAWPRSSQTGWGSGKLALGLCECLILTAVEDSSIGRGRLQGGHRRRRAEHCRHLGTPGARDCL